MSSKLNVLFLLTIIAIGNIALAQQSQIKVKMGEELHGMQVNYNLQKQTEVHYGDMCDLTFLKNLNGAFLVNVSPGSTAPRSLIKRNRIMTVNQINNDTFVGIGSEIHYNDYYNKEIIIKTNDKVVIKLNEKNAPDSYELTSENNIDQVFCSGLLNVGI